MMDKKVEKIGIDHGWSHIKTVHDIFVSGVKEMSTEPALPAHVIEYKNKWYKIGGTRMAM